MAKNESAAKGKKLEETYQRWLKARPEAPSVTLDKGSALVEVMVIAACIDGILADGESLALSLSIRAIPGFEALDKAGLVRTVDAITARVAQEGIEARIDAIAATLGDDVSLREEAFILATLFAHFDGEVGDEEQSLLDAMQKKLDISDERASHIDAVLTETTESP